MSIYLSFIQLYFPAQSHGFAFYDCGVHFLANQHDRGKSGIFGLQDELYRNISKYGICFCKKRCQVKFGGVDRFEY